MAEPGFTSDPILDELHAVRRQMLDSCGGDLGVLIARLKQAEQFSGHPLAQIPVPRVNEETQPAETGEAPEA